MSKNECFLDLQTTLSMKVKIRRGSAYFRSKEGTFGLPVTSHVETTMYISVRQRKCLEKAPENQCCL
jgi:hypothetical protein